MAVLCPKSTGDRRAPSPPMDTPYAVDKIADATVLLSVAVCFDFSTLLTWTQFPSPLAWTMRLG